MMPNQLFGMEIVDSKQLQKQFWSFDDYYDLYGVHAVLQTSRCVQYIYIYNINNVFQHLSQSLSHPASEDKLVHLLGPPDHENCWRFIGKQWENLRKTMSSL